MKRTARIEDILRPLEREQTQGYISASLQVADILEWILGQLHDSHGVTVYQTTFSISEEFLRRTYFIKRDNPGTRFVVIIDRKALQKTVSLWRFVRSVYDEVYLSDNHSKVLLVDDPRSYLTALVTSQNLTRGNRCESAVLTTAGETTDRLLKDFMEMRDRNSAPMHEIMPSGDGALPARRDGCGDVDYCEEIERLAGYFVPVSDIATVLELDHLELRARLADEKDPWSLAYRKGKAKAKVALRAQEMELAKVGSPLGMQSVKENLFVMENDEE